MGCSTRVSSLALAPGIEVDSDGIIGDEPAPVVDERRRVWPINVNQALLILRLVVGLLFVGHAAQKLFGWFGGTGMAEFIASVAKLGLNPPVFWAHFEAFAELGGGLFLVLGLLTPFAAAAIIGDMLVAIVKVHAPKGLWSQSGGYEYNLVLIVVLVDQCRMVKDATRWRRPATRRSLWGKSNGELFSDPQNSDSF